MPQLKGRSAPTIRFPYMRGAEMINAKYRTFVPVPEDDPEGKLFCMRAGAELRFWNLDAVLSGSKRIAYIFEGEMDGLAGFEAGLPQECILSVPNGAPERPSDDPEEQDRYRFVKDAIAEGLLTVEKLVIATDNDGPGMALRNDLVRLLGAAKCWFIDWPSGVKDCNRALEKWGPGELLDYLEGEPKAWPVEGLFRMSEIPEPPPLRTWQLGFPEWESKLLFAPGTLQVFTGYPGHGKTLMAMQLWFNVAREYGVKVAIASFETNAKPHQRRNLRQFYWSKPQSEMSDAERAKADEWIDAHFVWMQHPLRRPSLKWFLDLAEVAVIRNRCQAVQVDPWNKLEWERPEGARETDWIRNGLNECMSFAKDLNVLFQILAHPAKRHDRSARREAPQLDDIAGSAHWDNIVDQGLAIFRPKTFEDGERKTEAELFHHKARFEELGHTCALDVAYDLKKCRYLSTDYQKAWQQ